MKKHVSMFKRGFTLIELLVVIAIIGTLTAIVTASLNEGKAKSRDAKRIADIKQIELALTVYFDVHGEFPCENQSNCNNPAQTADASAPGAASTVGIIDSDSEVYKLIAPYLSELPTDPLYDGTEYYYYYDGSHNCNGIGSSVAIVYAAKMEEAKNVNFMNTVCKNGAGDGLGGEGRNNGTESYNVILGPTSG